MHMTRNYGVPVGNHQNLKESHRFRKTLLSDIFNYLDKVICGYPKSTHIQSLHKLSIISHVYSLPVGN